jgi:glutamate racemase
MWVPLVENNEHRDAGADYFVEKYINLVLAQDERIDCLLLACTHYPLLVPKISQRLPPGIQLVGQGEIVAESLAAYLIRHPEIANKLGRNQSVRFTTTGDPIAFDTQASLFFGAKTSSTHISII